MTWRGRALGLSESKGVCNVPESLEPLQADYELVYAAQKLAAVP